MKKLYVYLVLAFLILSANLASAQSPAVKYLSKSWREVAPSEAYYFEVEEGNGLGGGTRTYFLVEDSSKAHLYTYSDLNGGEYKRGILDGPHHAWHKNGHLKLSAEYKNGELNGEYKGWYESGKLWYRKSYIDGKAEGKLEGYYKSGAVRRVELYEDGKLVSGKVFDEAGKEMAFFPMEQMPEFPGGEQALLRWLGSNVKYPKTVRKANAQGLVVISFVVSKEGQISEAEVVKGFHPDADAEGLRVINGMPVWRPWLQEGEPVAVRYTLPIRFSIR